MLSEYRSPETRDGGGTQLEVQRTRSRGRPRWAPGTLLEAKARGYDKWFDKDLEARFMYEGADDMVKQARRQLRLAGGLRVRWHVAEPRMVAILKKLFKENNIEGIEVVHTLPLPGT
jgi:hypothetical protein